METEKETTAEPLPETRSGTPERAEVGDGTALVDTPQDLERKLEQAQNEAAQTYERFLRVAAELDNFRKRSMREVEEIRKYANESLLRDLLTVVDNLERAIDSSSDGNVETIVQGVGMTLAEVRKVLEKHRVKSLDSVGKPFDPAFHQAFMTETSQEHPENTVIREFRRGYLLYDRLLRPAMVVVAKAPATETDPRDHTDNG